MILLHLNGPPAVGKTTVAELVVSARPGSLFLDIDSIRVSLPGWRDYPETKQRARSIAFAAAAEHLRGGGDVVLPQLDVRIEVLSQLQQLASDVGASFVEVHLVADRDELLRRFRGRAGEHPANEEADVEALVDHYLAEVERVHRAWPTAIVIESTTPAETAQRVLAALPSG